MPASNNFSDNVARWLSIADLKIDFYTQFIKSWIPFNAWYMVSFYDESSNRTSDRSIIDYVKNNSNPFRDKIINLLRGEDEESKEFRFQLAKLFSELESHSIPNHDYRISFTSINITRNPITNFTTVYRGLHYVVTFNITAPKTTKRLKCEIIEAAGAMRTIYLDEFYDWSMEALLNSTSYKSLSPERRERLRLCYGEVNPYKPINVVVKPTVARGTGKYLKPTRCTVIDSDNHLYFIEDKEILSKVIIEIFYLLRCALFHGEINPTETNQVIYERAYYILKILIQELK